MKLTTVKLVSRWRHAVSASAFLAGAAHIPVIPEHLREAPYVGWLFVGFTVTTFVLAVAVEVWDVPLIYVVAGGVGAAAIAAYALFRLVPMPQMAGEVGMWYDPYGVAALFGETLLVATCMLTVRRATSGAATGDDAER